MNAKDALQISMDNLKGPVVEPYLDAVYVAVKVAAQKGQRSIQPPWASLRMPYPSSDAQEQVWLRLAQEGYKVVHHPDPDPGYPGSGPYTVISW